MTFQAVIFDCDGTLVDSETLGHEVLCGCVAEFGMRLSMEESMRRFKGGKMADCVTELEADLGRRLPENFVPHFRQRCVEEFEARLKPMEGARELLERLQLPYCLASSGPREKIELNLRVTRLSSYFENRIFSAYDINVWKPDPGLFLHAAKEMAFDSSTCAVVEDSIYGYRAGVEAGMTVFALEGDKVPDDLADQVRPIRKLLDLLSLVHPMK